MQCDRVQPLVPVYVDGELREELARPLRQHLLECQACRGVVAETKSLSSWFVPSPEVAVPEGFAASVVRRAFAGANEADHVLVPAVPSAGGLEGGRVIDGAQRFAMNLVGAAAAALAVLTLWLASDDSQRLTGGSLSATPTVQDAMNHLKELNGRDAATPNGAGEEKDEATTDRVEDSGR